MTAVLGADTAVIENICEETEGIVSIANYNCPGQIVITGEQRSRGHGSGSLERSRCKTVYTAECQLARSTQRCCCRREKNLRQN